MASVKSEKIIFFKVRKSQGILHEVRKILNFTLKSVKNLEILLSTPKVCERISLLVIKGNVVPKIIFFKFGNLFLLLLSWLYCQRICLWIWPVTIGLQFEFFTLMNGNSVMSIHCIKGCNNSSLD